MNNKSTILLSKETRALLLRIGRKNQTYDQVIKELINTKSRLDVLESQNKNYSSESFSNYKGGEGCIEQK